MKIISAGHPELKPVMDVSATVLILGLVTALALYIVYRFVLGVREELAMKKHKVMAA